MAKLNEGINPGAGYIRLAIVHDHETIKEAADRLAEFLSKL